MTSRRQQQIFNQCLYPLHNVIFISKNRYMQIYVPCPLRPYAIIALHDFMSFVAVSNVCLFAISTVPFCHPFTQAHQLSYFLLPSASFCLLICPVRVKFSEHSFLIMGSRNFKYLFLIPSINVLSGSIFFKTLSLLTFGPWYPQHASLEPHLCCYKSLLYL